LVLLEEYITMHVPLNVKLPVTPGGFNYTFRTIICIVCTLVWRRDDGCRSDRNMSV